MRLALLAPTFPPKICGVGDHAWNLAHAWAEAGHKVTVFTWMPEEQIPQVHCNITIISTKKIWDSDAVAAAGRDGVFLEYTPYVFSERFGLHWPLVPFLRRLRRSSLRGPLVLLAHEMHYPIEWTKAGMTLGPLQKILFRILLGLSDRVVFTYEAGAKTWGYPEDKKISWNPVGSNIPFIPLESPEDFRRDKGLGQGKLLVHFGGAHPTHDYAMIAEALEILAKSGTYVDLRCIGVEDREIQKILASKGRSLPNNWKNLGRLPREDISHWLGAADLVVAPFIDGISTRRGSAIAALMHQKNVVSTEGHYTDPSFPWASITSLVPLGNAAALAERISTLLKSSAPPSPNANNLKPFQWPEIAANLLDRLH